MADGKKSVIIYSDLIHTVRKLPREKAGDLLMVILEYINDLNPDVDDVMVELVFEPIKQQMKRDLKKWEAIKEKRSDAGKASAEAKKALKEADQNATKSTSVESVEQNQQQATHSTVSVNVNDTVNVNGNVTVNEINKQKEGFVFSEIQDKQDELTRSICQINGFDQGEKYASNRRIVSQFVLSQLKSFEELDHFIDQYKNYKEYKRVSEEKEHNFSGYFGTPAMQFSNGAWNSENWGLKLEQYNLNNKKSTKFERTAQAYNDAKNPYE